MGVETVSFELEKAVSIKFKRKKSLPIKEYIYV